MHCLHYRPIIRGKRVYEKPRFMTVAEASSQILQAIAFRQQDTAEPMKSIYYNVMSSS